MSTNEQLAWDFDDGDVAEVRPDTGIARFAPGSEQWIAALHRLTTTRYASTVST